MDPAALQMLESISSKMDSLIDNMGDAPAVAPVPTAAATIDSKMVETLRRITGILDPQELLVAVMDVVIDITGAERGFLMLLEGGRKLRFKVGRGVEQESLGSAEFSASKTIIKKVITEGKPVFMTEPGMGGSPSQSIVNLGLRSICCVPLIFGQRTEGQSQVGGIIYVDSHSDTKTLSDKEMGLLEGLATQAAVAIENAQIFDKAEQDRIQVLRLKNNIAKLYEVGQSISRTLDLDELQMLVMDHVVAISNAQRGFVMLLEGVGEKRKLVFKLGRDSRQKTLPEEAFAFSSTIARKCIDEKKPQVLVDALGGGGQDASVSMVSMELQSIMAVPLLEKGDVIGLVYVDSKTTNKSFGGTDLELLEALAGSAAVAIVNAKLYATAQEQARMAHEMDRAAEIQRSLLPESIPEVVGLEIHGFMVPAKEVGGDYYDVIAHAGTNESVTICVGDVSGKGVGAGMVMTMARTMLHSLVESYGVPESTLPLMQNLNTVLCNSVKRGVFMTLNVLNWWSASHSLRYTPAGHEHLILWRAEAPDPELKPEGRAQYMEASQAYLDSGKVECIQAGGVAAAVLLQANNMMAEKELILNPGDHLLLYSDGVTEAMNEQSDEFELETTISIVGRYGSLSPEDLCNKVYDEIKVFAGDAEQHDDITLVAIRCTQ